MWMMVYVDDDTPVKDRNQALDPVKIRRLGRSVEISELLPGRKHEGLKEDTYTRCFSKNLSLSILGLGSFVSFLMYFLTSQLWHFKKKTNKSS